MHDDLDDTQSKLLISSKKFDSLWKGEKIF